MFESTSFRRFPVVVSSSDHGVGHALVHVLCRAARAVPSSCSTVGRRSSRARRGPRPAPSDPGSGWQRPVDGPVVQPFDAPAPIYGAGHRGVDFAAAPGTPVRAANDGVVSFAGCRGRHAARHHHPRRRPPHLVLVPVVGVGPRGPDASRAATSSGRRGGVGADHDGSVLHLGLRVGDRYVDPMALFRPSDLTKLVRLVPGGRAERDAVVAGRASDATSRSSLRLPDARRRVTARAYDRRRIVRQRRPADRRRGRRGVRRRRLARRPAPTTRSTPGIGFLDATTTSPTTALEGLRASVRIDGRGDADARRAASAAALARTPAGQLALDVVAIGRRFADTVTADCSDDAPDADGTGGSAHRVMVVAGINSSGAAWDRGPTVALDVEALGYHADEGEVRYFSYAADGGPYTAEDTHGPIEVAAHRLDAQLRAMQREQPGREVDLIAHSQGGVVVDWFLAHVYDAGDHDVSRRSATSSRCRRRTRARRSRPPGGRSARPTVGRAVLDALEGVSSLPPPSSAAVQRARRGLAADAPPVGPRRPRPLRLHHHRRHRGPRRPGHADLGARARPRPSPRSTASTSTARSCARPTRCGRCAAALEGRPPPCVGLLTALRSAVAPVVISRVEHTIGSGAAAVLGGCGRMNRRRVRAARGARRGRCSGRRCVDARRRARLPTRWCGVRTVATARGTSAPTPAAWSWSTSSWACSRLDRDGHEQWTASGRRSSCPAPPRSTATSCSSAASRRSPRWRVATAAVRWRATDGRTSPTRSRWRATSRSPVTGPARSPRSTSRPATVRWSVHFPGSLWSAPRVDRATGAVVAVWHETDAPAVRVLDLATGALRWQAPTGGVHRRARRPRTGSSCSRSATATGTPGSRRATWPPAVRRWQTPVPASFEEAIEPAVDDRERRGGRPLRRGHRCSTWPPGGCRWQHDLARALLDRPGWP